MDIDHTTPNEPSPCSTDTAFLELDCSFQGQEDVPDHTLVNRATQMLFWATLNPGYGTYLPPLESILQLSDGQGSHQTYSMSQFSFSRQLKLCADSSAFTTASGHGPVPQDTEVSTAQATGSSTLSRPPLASLPLDLNIQRLRSPNNTFPKPQQHQSPATALSHAHHNITLPGSHSEPYSAPPLPAGTSPHGQDNVASPSFRRSTADPAPSHTHTYMTQPLASSSAAGFIRENGEQDVEMDLQAPEPPPSDPSLSESDGSNHAASRPGAPLDIGSALDEALKLSISGYLALPKCKRRAMKKLKLGARRKTRSGEPSMTVRRLGTGRLRKNYFRPISVSARRRSTKSICKKPRVVVSSDIGSSEATRSRESYPAPGTVVRPSFAPSVIPAAGSYDGPLPICIVHGWRSELERLKYMSGAAGTFKNPSQYARELRGVLNQIERNEAHPQLTVDVLKETRLMEVLKAFQHVNGGKGPGIKSLKPKVVGICSRWRSRLQNLQVA